MRHSNGSPQEVGIINQAFSDLNSSRRVAVASEKGENVVLTAFAGQDYQTEVNGEGTYMYM